MAELTELSEEAASAAVVIVTGPTATGKTRLAVRLANDFHGEVVSADSRQLYCGLDLGTGKDLEEYQADGMAVPYHLIDVALPGERFDLFRYLELARRALNQIVASSKLPVVCGGTPLYLSALLKGYAMVGGQPDLRLREDLERRDLPELLAMLRQCASPELLARTDLTQPRRVIRAIEIARHPECAIRTRALSHPLILAPKYTRDEVRSRIETRLKARLQAGMVEEVRALHDERGISWEQLDWFGLEYRYVSRYLRGMLAYDEMYCELLNHIRQFARRQDIWFRKLEREGNAIHWIDHGDYATARELVEKALGSGAFPGISGAP